MKNLFIFFQVITYFRWKSYNKIKKTFYKKQLIWNQQTKVLILKNNKHQSQ